MDIKNEVLYRIYILLFGIVVPVSIALSYRTVQISILDGERWRAQGRDNYLEYRQVEADRGNIVAADGSLLATSIPYFDLFFDPHAPREEDYQKYMDTLAQCLATYVLEDYTVGGARELLQSLRKAADRHVILKRKASYAEKKFIEDFPLFRLGRFRGGFIAEKRSERKRPFGLLAQRTIGYVRDNAKPVGLEGQFDTLLGGMPGQQLMIRVDPKEDLWMPVDDLTVIEPETGSDVVTNLDIDIQDIAEQALKRAMNAHDAEWGTAVVMEVETGAIRAMANLGRTDEGWWETYNYAVGAGIEPGSTFKAASVMALLEDGFVDLDDSIRIYNGRAQFYDDMMEDASPYSARLDTIRMREAFVISSNVGIATMVQDHYGEKTPENGDEGAVRFIKRLKQFNLNLPTGVEIDGEANPYIKEAYSDKDHWSGTTLPWMSIGYEMKITPLQLLAFYNAIANDGEMMKPYLVSEIRRFGETTRRFRPTVIDRRIASRETVARMQELLISVVEDERGTAHKLRSGRYSFAGKTGTAQINYRRGSRGTRVGGYQASFVGYFPVEKPKYSCIVVVNRPRRGGFYGGDVAGPVFREIADNIYTAKVELHTPVNLAPKPVLAGNTLPAFSIGDKKDMSTVFNYLEIPFYGEPETPVAVARVQSDSLILEQRTMPEDRVPNVVGLGLRDALYTLENRGLAVEIEGFGKVARQSLLPGTRIQGQSIRLYLQ
ncbi:MAG: transpeptidase family protein [Phaeodactylibacter sp.]|nr:transpeptidase family protein [Phaeodactylibacter sp.]MCB9264209.1 transpeptidase family protein [Lewinellaceae bacterium]MCB9291273.1 transpeptidase family protein [Lewinellaceae bacterium]